MAVLLSPAERQSARAAQDQPAAAQSAERGATQKINGWKVGLAPVCGLCYDTTETPLADSWSSWRLKTGDYKTRHNKLVG